MEYVYYGMGGLLVVGLLVLLVRTRRWIARSTSEGLEETLAFAAALGLEPLDPNGRNLKGVVEGLPVTLSEGAILVRGNEGRVGRMRTLRVIVEAGAGEWLLCERKLAGQLDRPLPEVGEEQPLSEPRAAQRFLLQGTEAPRFAADVQLLDALGQTELKIGRVAGGRTTLDFVAPGQLVGGLGGEAALLTRLLMVSLALAAPERARDFLGKAPAYR